MFKLIKLAAYALLGYALYEFFRGMADDRSEAQSGQPRAAAVGGQSRGASATTHDASGATAKHPVGRGVVNR